MSEPFVDGENELAGVNPLAEDIRRCQSGEAVRAENPILAGSPTKILPSADKPIFV